MACLDASSVPSRLSTAAEPLHPAAGLRLGVLQLALPGLGALPGQEYAAGHQARTSISTTNVAGHRSHLTRRFGRRVRARPPTARFNGSGPPAGSHSSRQQSAARGQHAARGSAWPLLLPSCTTGRLRALRTCLIAVG